MTKWELKLQVGTYANINDKSQEYLQKILPQLQKEEEKKNLTKMIENSQGIVKLINDGCTENLYSKIELLKICEIIKVILIKSITYRSFKLIPSRSKIWDVREKLMHA